MARIIIMRNLPFLRLRTSPIPSTRLLRYYLDLVESQHITGLHQVLVLLDGLHQVIHTDQVIHNSSLHLVLLDAIANLCKLVLLSPHQTLHLDALDELDQLIEVDHATGLIVIVIPIDAGWLHVQHNGGLANRSCLLLLCSLLLLASSHLCRGLLRLIIIIVVAEQVKVCAHISISREVELRSRLWVSS